jgi:hypothetical protein
MGQRGNEEDVVISLRRIAMPAAADGRGSRSPSLISLLILLINTALAAHTASTLRGRLRSPTNCGRKSTRVARRLTRRRTRLARSGSMPTARSSRMCPARSATGPDAKSRRKSARAMSSATAAMARAAQGRCHIVVHSTPPMCRSLSRSWVGAAGSPYTDPLPDTARSPTMQWPAVGGRQRQDARGDAERLD